MGSEAEMARREAGQLRAKIESMTEVHDKLVEARRRIANAARENAMLRERVDALEKMVESSHESAAAAADLIETREREVVMREAEVARRMQQDQGVAAQARARRRAAEAAEGAAEASAQTYALHSGTALVSAAHAQAYAAASRGLAPLEAAVTVAVVGAFETAASATGAMTDDGAEVPASGAGADAAVATGSAGSYGAMPGIDGLVFRAEVSAQMVEMGHYVDAMLND